MKRARALATGLVLLLAGCSTTVEGAVAGPVAPGADQAGTTGPAKSSAAGPASAAPTADAPTADVPTADVATTTAPTTGPPSAPTTPGTLVVTTTGKSPTGGPTSSTRSVDPAPVVPDPEIADLVEHIGPAMEEVTTYSSLVNVLHGPETVGFVADVTVEFEGEYITQFELEGGEGAEYIHLIFVDYVFYYRKGESAKFQKLAEDTENTALLAEANKVLTTYSSASAIYRPSFMLVAQNVVGPTQETVGEAVTRKYSMDIPMDEDRAEALLGDDPDATAFVEKMGQFGMREVPIEIWIDKSDRVLKYRQTMTVLGQVAPIELTLRNLNEPVRLKAPKASEVEEG